MLIRRFRETCSELMLFPFASPFVLAEMGPGLSSRKILDRLQGSVLSLFPLRFAQGTETVLSTDSQPAVSRLHEIYRRLRSAREGRLPALALAKREAKRVREIYRASRRYSQARDDVASSFQVSRLRQMIDAARFSFSENIDLGSYYKFSYFLSGNWKRRTEYIHHQEIVLLLEKLNAAISSKDSEDLVDKRRFTARIEKANLPGIPIVGSFEHGITLLEPSEDVFGKSDLFSKPVDRWCGEGAFRWTAEGDGYAGPDGAHKTLPQLAEALRLASKDGLRHLAEVYHEPSSAPADFRQGLVHLQNSDDQISGGLSTASTCSLSNATWRADRGQFRGRRIGRTGGP